LFRGLICASTYICTGFVVRLAVRVDKTLRSCGAEKEFRELGGRNFF